MTAKLMIENAALLADMHRDQNQQEALVHDLINGVSVTSDLLIARAENWGDLSENRGVYLVSFADYGREHQHKMVDSIRHWLSRHYPNDLMATVSSEQVVVLHTVGADKSPESFACEILSYSKWPLESLDQTFRCHGRMPKRYCYWVHT